METRIDRYMRGLYPGGHADERARRYARWWGRLVSTGLLPRRWVVLEVPGRRSGVVRRFPLGLADVDGEWFAVSMLGERDWVRNVRAAHGRVVLRGRQGGPATMQEVPVGGRPRVLRRYVQTVPGGRAHIAVDRHAPVDAFATVAAGLPVFRVVRSTGPPDDTAPL